LRGEVSDYTPLNISLAEQVARDVYSWDSNSQEYPTVDTFRTHIQGVPVEYQEAVQEAYFAWAASRPQRSPSHVGRRTAARRAAAARPHYPEEVWEDDYGYEDDYDRGTSRRQSYHSNLPKAQEVTVAELAKKFSKSDSRIRELLSKAKIEPSSVTKEFVSRTKTITRYFYVRKVAEEYINTYYLRLHKKIKSRYERPLVDVPEANTEAKSATVVVRDWLI
jgi:hypothetical protein